MYSNYQNVLSPELWATWWFLFSRLWEYHLILLLESELNLFNWRTLCCIPFTYAVCVHLHVLKSNRILVSLFTSRMQLTELNFNTYDASAIEIVFTITKPRFERLPLIMYAKRDFMSDTQTICHNINSRRKGKKKRPFFALS